MTQATTHDQKEQAAAWDKQCRKMQLKFGVVTLPAMLLVMIPFVIALEYFIELVIPLISGEVAYGQPGYYEYQAAKDQVLIVVAILFVLVIVVMYLTHRWYKKLIRALGPRPGGYPGKWKRWLGAV